MRLRARRVGIAFPSPAHLRASPNPRPPACLLARRRVHHRGPRCERPTRCMPPRRLYRRPHGHPAGRVCHLPLSPQPLASRPPLASRVGWRLSFLPAWQPSRQAPTLMPSSVRLPRRRPPPRQRRRRRWPQRRAGSSPERLCALVIRLHRVRAQTDQHERVSRERRSRVRRYCRSILYLSYLINTGSSGTPTRLGHLRFNRVTRILQSAWYLHAA